MRKNFITVCVFVLGLGLVSQDSSANTLSCPASAKVKKYLVTAINSKISEDLKSSVSNIKVRTKISITSVSKETKPLSADMFGVGVAASVIPATNTSDASMSVNLSEVAPASDMCVYTASATFRVSGITTDAARKKVSLRASVNAFTFKSALASSGKLTKG